jgi:hypothetical protein
MKNTHNEPAHSSQPDLPPTVEGDEVRATMEQARQALEASRSEIERAKRLLRETEELADVPGHHQDTGGDSVSDELPADR